jgi:hypothetical protein
MSELSCLSFVPCIENAPEGVTGDSAIHLSKQQVFDLYYGIKKWNLSDVSFGVSAGIEFELADFSTDWLFNASPDPNYFDRSNGGVNTEKDLACSLSMGSISSDQGSYSRNTHDSILSTNYELGLKNKYGEPAYYKKDSNYLYLPLVLCETQYTEYSPGSKYIMSSFFSSWNDPTSTPSSWDITYYPDINVYFSSINYTTYAGNLIVNEYTLPVYGSIFASEFTNQSPTRGPNITFSSSFNGTITTEETWPYNP